MTEDYKKEWQRGYDYTVQNFKLGQLFKHPTPISNGCAEGVNSGRSFVIDRDYPGWNIIKLRADNKYDVEFKDGRKIIV